MDLKSQIREVPDFPSAGISFKDITTLLRNGEALNYTAEAIINNFKDHGITKVLGIESRGFILGGIIANALGAGFVPVRKKGKLPSKTIAVCYELEYGMDCVEIHADALEENDVVLIHDDLLATGGTAYAVLQMVRKLNIDKVCFSFICDLGFIDSEKKHEIKKYETQILVKY